MLPRHQQLVSAAAPLGSFSAAEDKGLLGGGPPAESSQAQTRMPGCRPRALSRYGSLRVTHGSLRPSTSLGAAASFWECHPDLRALELGVFNRHECAV